MKKLKYTCSVFLILVTLLSVQLSSSEIVSDDWTEDFEKNFSLWNKFAYRTVESNKFSLDTSLNYEIEKGMATHPDLSSDPNNGPSFILHTSNLSYGEWTAEYLLPQQADEIYIIFSFVLDIENETSENFLEIDETGNLKNINGYALIITGSIGAKKWFSQNATILLIRIDPSKLSLKTGVLLTSPWEGNNGILGVFNNFPKLKLPENLRIKITRNSDGNFKVYYNSEHIFNIEDNLYSSSKYVLIGSWGKSHYTDNITVNHTIRESTTTVFMNIKLIIPTVILYTILRRKA